jgi:hypothetical protein
MYSIEEIKVNYNIRMSFFLEFSKTQKRDGCPPPLTRTLTDRIERDKKSRVISNSAPAFLTD